MMQKQCCNKKMNIELPCSYGDMLYQVVPIRTIDYPHGVYKEYDIKRVRCAGFELRPLQNFLLDEERQRINFQQFGDKVFYTKEDALRRKDELNMEWFKSISVGTVVWELDTYSDETSPHIVECVIKSVMPEGDSILFEIEGKDDITHDNVISSDVFNDWLFLTERDANTALERYIASRPHNGWMLEKE